MNIVQNPFWAGDFADPFVLKVRGTYYAYATEPAEQPAAGTPIFPILASDDLVSWREVGHALPALGEPYFRYWAPEVTEHNGQFLFYYAVHTEPFTAAIRVAVSDHPAGPFRDTGHDLTSQFFPWAIDPHVFRDRDGQWYLYYTIEYLETETGLVGSGNVVDRLLDPFTLAGTPARVTPPRHAWQLFEAQRAEKGGVDWYCVEAPAVIRHRTRYYETFSGGCYYRDNYAVSYATAPAPLGPGGMHDTSWEDQSTDESRILMRGRAGQLVSPGHNSLFLAPNNVDLYLAYHAWPRDRSGRRPCLDPLYWHGETPWTPGPTVAPQPAPAWPRLLERFQHEQLDPAWSPGAGCWEVHQAAVLQTETQASQATLMHAAPLGVAWVLEANLRHLAGDGCYGVTFVAARGGRLSVCIAPAQRRLVARYVPDGARPAATGPDVAAVDLPPGFRVEAWHQVLIIHAGHSLAVRLDGLPVLQVAFDALSVAFGLMTERCSAGFAAIALTDHFTDEFLDSQQDLADLGWWEPAARPAAGTLFPGEDLLGVVRSPAGWDLQAGMLAQRDPWGTHRLLKGSSLRHCEFGVTLRLLEAAAGGAPRLGVILMASGEQTAEVGASAYAAGVTIGAVLARHGETWEVQVALTGAEPSAIAAAPLPDTFDPRDWHTLRLTLRQGHLTLHLDGPAFLALHVPDGPYTCGLFTAEAACAFMRAWQTGLPA